MQDKENVCKKSLKRHSSAYDTEIVVPKRISFGVNYSNNSNISHNSPSNPKPILSSCLTNDLKFNCVLKNQSKNYDFGTPEKQIIPIEQFKNLPKPVLKELDNEIILPRLPIYSSTPVEEIDSITVSQLSDPENVFTVEESMWNLKSNNIAYILDNKCLTSINTIGEIRQNNNLLDDSFEYLKRNLRKCKSVTPANFGFNPSFLTPETPCDFNEIDLEIQQNELQSQLPSTSEMKKSKRNNRVTESISISPMFYDDITKPLRIRKSRSNFAVQNFGLSGTANEDNKIEEMSVEDVSQIIENDFTSDSYAYHIIDCRYPYEYDGGHISSAVNLYTPWQLLNYVFLSNYDLEYLKKPLDDPEKSMEILIDNICNIQKPNSNWKYQAFIFHCEFSSFRGPEMARCLRNVDRYANVKCYPQLFFPKVYIMKKGYKEFYNKFKMWCQPCNYIKMDIKMDQRVEQNSIEFDENDDDNVIDEDIREFHIRQYNECKKETQEQLKLLSAFV